MNKKQEEPDNLVHDSLALAFSDPENRYLLSEVQNAITRLREGLVFVHEAINDLPRVIQDDDTFRQVEVVLSDAAAYQVRVDEFLAEAKDHFNKRHKAVCAIHKHFSGPASELEEAARNRLNDYLHADRGEDTGTLPKGASGTVTNPWSTGLIDIGKLPREYMTPDWPKINKAVNELGVDAAGLLGGAVLIKPDVRYRRR